MTELLSCPFCGGEAESVSLYGPEGLFRVRCHQCQARVASFDRAEQDAREAWNTRASAAPEEGEPVADKPENVMRVYNEARKLTPREQYYAAEMIANNVGYELVEEAEHPDSPHAALPPATEDGGREPPLAKLLKEVDPGLADILTDNAAYVRVIRGNVIEECAKVAEKFPVSRYSSVARANIAKAIRALPPSPSVGTPEMTSADSKDAAQ